MSLTIKEKIVKLKKEKNAVILAHYYVNDEIQEIADYIGDSFYLSKIATTIESDVIVFCGVSFMGESAKILNPKKTVLLPDMNAKCAMAEMCSPEKVCKMREIYDDLAVVCYINSTAALKQVSDVCVTSSNAVKIVNNLPNKNIFFIPDENLGRYVSKLVTNKNFIFNDGYCPVHKEICDKDVELAKSNHPDALLLAHPECTNDVLKYADYIGSTSEIIDFTAKDEHSKYLIATEIGVFYELKKRNPEKVFLPVKNCQICPDMKLITLDKVLSVLENNSNQVNVSPDVIENASKPLRKMLELAK